MPLNTNEVKTPSCNTVVQLTFFPHLLLGFAHYLHQSAAVGWVFNPSPVEQLGMAELLANAPSTVISLLALAAVARTLHRRLLKQPGSTILVELLGCTLGIACVTCAWSAIHIGVPKEHTNLVDSAMIYGAKIATRALRKQAEAFRRLAAEEANSGGRCFARARSIRLEALMHFLAGAVDGALDGMLNLPRW